MAKINVKNTEVTVIQIHGVDYISLTDIAKFKTIDPNAVIGNWMRNRNTIEYLGIWECLYNPLFKPLEFEGFKKEAGLNAFTLSPQKWIETTAAIGLISKSGRYGGTFAHKDIAFKFASWISIEFELYVVKEFQRLKEEEQKALGWSAKRELAKINYHIHTDAIKQNLIPQELTLQQTSVIYAGEADVLNMARGSSRPERQYPRLCHHQRTDLPVEHGKHQCRAHPRRTSPGRAADKAEQNRHSANEHIAGRGKPETAAMKFFL
jgi:hypothetical protein